MFEKLCKKNGGSIKVKDIFNHLKSKIDNFHIFVILVLAIVFICFSIEEGINEAIKFYMAMFISLLIITIPCYLIYKLITSKIIKKIHAKFMNTTIIKCKKE